MSGVSVPHLLPCLLGFWGLADPHRCPRDRPTKTDPEGRKENAGPEAWGTERRACGLASPGSRMRALLNGTEDTAETWG